MTISIRNNCDGGGGNDWALDDIRLATCNPGVTMTPSTGSTSVCLGNPVDISSTVRAFFNNYVEYRWEKSTNNGASWTVANTGTGSPVLVSGQYEYTAPYPTFIADSASHMNQYKFVVASSSPNLADSNCNFLASTTIVVMVNGCWEVLKTKMLNFRGNIKNGNANLYWVSDNEVPGTKYEIERSTDKINFSKVGTVHGKVQQGSPTNYNFEDNLPVNGNVYYRLKIIEGNTSIYSKIVLVGNTLEYSIRSLINPFRNNLSFDLITPDDGIVTIILYDPYGKAIKREKQTVKRGLNTQSINNLGNIQLGIYTLQIEMSGKTIIRRVIKLND
jgi:hypothetical protein